MSQDMEQPTPEEQRLAEEGKAIVAAAVASTRAPLGLRERIESDRARLGGAGRRRRWLAPALATFALVLLVAVGLSLNDTNAPTGGGRAGGPTVLALVNVAGRGPAASAPKEDPARPNRLQAAVGPVAFPYYDGSLPWRPTGQRSDLVFGARSRTVYYRGPDGTPAAYTIVPGTGLALSGARTVTRGGTDYRVARVGGRTIVTWEVQGHTCVISAPSKVGDQALLRLAWWQG
jgi:hypothetical protein